METVLVNDEITQQLRQMAAQSGETLETLTERGLREFLRVTTRRAMRREVQAFQAQHTALLAQYSGQYIAMYQGQVIDVDVDQLALLARIDAIYPHTPVLIMPVRADSVETYTMRSPRWETPR